MYNLIFKKIIIQKFIKAFLLSLLLFSFSTSISYSAKEEKKKEDRELEDVEVITSSEEIEKIKSKQKKILGIFNNPYANANPDCRKYDFYCKRTAPKVYVVETDPEKMLEFGVKENTQFKFFTGMFDFSDHKQSAVLVGMQHHNESLFRESFLGKITPITGGFVTGSNSLYFYTGGEAEYTFGRLKINPSFAPGLYRQSGGKDLGHVLEFKTEVKAAVEIGKNNFLGMSYNHISNASLGTKNPGANSYMFNFRKQF